MAIRVQQNVLTGAIKFAIKEILNHGLPGFGNLADFLYKVRSVTDADYVYDGDSFHLLQNKEFFLESNSFWYHTPETHAVYNYAGTIVDGVSGVSLQNWGVIQNVRATGFVTNKKEGNILNGYFGEVASFVNYGNIQDGTYHMMANYGNMSAGVLKGFSFNQSTISNAHFEGPIRNLGTINNSHFYNKVENEKTGVINNGDFRGEVENKGGIINNAKASSIDTTDGKLENVEANNINVNDGKTEILNSKVDVVHLANKAILKTNSVANAIGDGYIEKNGALYDLNGNAVTHFVSGENDDYDNLADLSIIIADGQQGNDTLKLNQNSRIQKAINYEKIILDGVEARDNDGVLLLKEVAVLNSATLNNLVNFSTEGGYLIDNSNSVATQVYLVGASQAGMMPELTFISTLVGNYLINQDGELMLAGAVQNNELDIAAF